jgi:hypothetical protein
MFTHRSASKVKANVSSTTKTHFVRGAFYLLFLLAVCVILFALAQRTTAKGDRPANVITVTNTNDSGPGSLRQALADANDGDTINFDPALNGQTILLTTAELAIAKNVTISGPGANLLAVSRDQNAPGFRIFHVAPSHTVIIQGITITHGIDVTGAGIWNDHATLTVNSCAVTGNSATDSKYAGGGILNDGFCCGAGPGPATLNVANSTISGNSANAGFGGGIMNLGLGFPATLAVSNSTITGNTARDQAGGGGIDTSSDGQAVATVANSTLSDNFGYAGIINDGELTIGNTVLKAGARPTIIKVGFGHTTSAGYNLSSDNADGLLNGPGDQINTDPMLGPLQDNGGPTSTHALLPGSPAIDAGDPKFTPPPYYDQRGPVFWRVRNGRIDVGSFEVQAGTTPSPTPTPTASPTPTPTPTPCGSITQIGGVIVPGTTDIGNHCDDCVTTVLLPFPFTLYDQTFTAVNLSSNGNAQFTTMDPGYSGQCLPWIDHNYTIFPYWEDLYLVNSGYGIYTSISGTAPNRIFNIEWRAQYFPGIGTANFELRLYEGQARFDVIYGTVTNGNLTATAGVQRDNTCFTQYFCNGSGPPPIGGWTLVPVGTPTPTPTSTATSTATATPTPTVATATPTATATHPPTATPTSTPTATATLTPRPSPTPRPRPTPPPRPH